MRLVRCASTLCSALLALGALAGCGQSDGDSGGAGAGGATPAKSPTRLPTPTTAAELADALHQGMTTQRAASFALVLAACCNEDLEGAGWMSYGPGGEAMDVGQVRNPNPATGDANNPDRVIIVGQDSYVRQGDSWKHVPVTSDPLAGGRGNAATASSQATEVKRTGGGQNILALLKASGDGELSPDENGVTYSGKADLSELTENPASGPLYERFAQLTGKLRVRFTVTASRTQAGYVPAELDLTLRLRQHGGTLERDYAVTYENWGKGGPIQRPQAG